jgi:prepilin-type N-terminal cleavage/methylation domain-containing protein
MAVRLGFTLIEILIVVVLLAILAAVLVPQLGSSTKDAADATAQFNLQNLREQVELYKAQHAGATPATLDKLTFRSNSSGATGSDAVAFPLGPYLSRLPENPANHQTGVDAISTSPPTAVGANTAGWLYHSTSGNVFLNDANWLSW